MISTLLLIERSSAQDTRRAVGALRVIEKITLVGGLGEASLGGRIHEIDDNEARRSQRTFS